MNSSWKFVPVHTPPGEGFKIPKKFNPYQTKNVIYIYNFSQFKIGHVRKRSEFNDYDYIHKLDPKTRDWLYRFHREWLCADLQHEGKKFHVKRTDRRKCWDKNNSMGRDTYAIKRTERRLIFLGDNVFDLVDGNNYLFNEDLEVTLYGESFGITEKINEKNNLYQRVKSRRNSRKRKTRRFKRY